MTDEDRIGVVANAIRFYLQNNPDSADTVEGIHDWWLVLPDQADSILITYSALVTLENSGVIERHLVSHRELWRLPRKQSDTAK